MNRRRPVNYNYDANVTLTNCTNSGNSSAATGGGVAATTSAGTTTLTNCTVSGNSALIGGGLSNQGDTGTVTLGNTIVAGNTATTSGPDAFGTVVSEGHNLIGKTDGSTGWVSSDLTGTSAAPLGAGLAPLGKYGGPAQTLALLPGSPAIDAGSNSLIPSGVTTDQRGAGSPRIVNSAVDIGAFESSGFTMIIASGTGQLTGLLTAFAAPLVVTVTANNLTSPWRGPGHVHPPPSGASATISVDPATINASGTASVTATANNQFGSETVPASASGAKTRPALSCPTDTHPRSADCPRRRSPTVPPRPPSRG